MRSRRQKVRVLTQIIVRPFPPALELFMRQHSCGYYSAFSRETSSFVVAENFLKYTVEKLLFIVMYIFVFTKFLTDGHQHYQGRIRQDHSVLKWILRGYFNSPPNTRVEVIFKVIFITVLIVLSYHTHLLPNIFDTDISRVAQIPKFSGSILPLFYIFMSLEMSLSEILDLRWL